MVYLVESPVIDGKYQMYIELGSENGVKYIGDGYTENEGKGLDCICFDWLQEMIEYRHMHVVGKEF